MAKNQLQTKKTKMENRTKVYSSESEQSAGIVKDRLLSEGIDAIVLDRKDHVSEVIGNYEVHVVNDQAATARAILSEHGE